MPIQPTRESSNLVTAGLIGLAVGDALGVPVEFSSRTERDRDPATDMRAFGAHHQPAGTWSDDTSLTLCLVESLCEAGVDVHDQAERFVGWLRRAEWTPHGEVFDIGGTTHEAIVRLEAGIEPTKAGSTIESSCGNGSLMRILPIALYLAHAPKEERLKTAMQCSRLTHGHTRCQLACAMYVELAAAMVRGMQLSEALRLAQETLQPIIEQQFPSELTTFARLLAPGLEQLDRSELSGSGYVIDCLESSLWCALRAESFSAGVLAAVNLGSDTDTTGAVAGSLLGLRFGFEAIPKDWIDQLARREEVFSLIEQFQQKCLERWKTDQSRN